MPREMTEEERIQARRDNVIIAARNCLKTNFNQSSQAILRFEVARLDVELKSER